MTHAKGQGSEQSGTSRHGPEISNERRNAQAQAGDLRDPRSIWENAETEPMPRRGLPARPGGGDRIADEGDIGARETTPHDIALQAEEVGRQTRQPRRGETHDTRRPINNVRSRRGE